MARLADRLVTGMAIEAARSLNKASRRSTKTHAYDSESLKKHRNNLGIASLFALAGAGIGVAGIIAESNGAGLPTEALVGISLATLLFESISAGIILRGGKHYKSAYNLPF